MSLYRVSMFNHYSTRDQSYSRRYKIDRMPSGPLSAYCVSVSSARSPIDRCDACTIAIKNPATPGCSDLVNYESLPALLSWLIANGYTTKPDMATIQLNEREFWIYGS